MARHTLYCCNDESEGWLRIGTMNVPGTLAMAEYQSDMDVSLVAAIFLVENPELGAFFYGGKLLSFVEPDIPLREQIDTFNDAPDRSETHYLPYDTPVYTIHERELPALAARRVCPMVAFGTGGVAFTLFPHHPTRDIATQVSGMATTRRAVAGALGITLSPRYDAALASPWDAIECAWARLVPDTGRYALDDPLTPATILPSPAMDEDLNDRVLAIYRTDDIAQFLLDADGAGDDAPGFHDAVMAAPALPLAAAVVPCQQIAAAPLLLVPDFCMEWRRLHTLYSYSLNHNTVFDLASACAISAGSAMSVPVSHMLKGVFGDLVLLPPGTGRTNFFNEVFIQDAYLPACTWSGRWKKAQVNCAHGTRMKMLDRVDDFFSLPGAPSIEQNYGGNFVVSPPVLVATGAIAPAGVAMGACGPAIAGHAVAPYGKIVVGDCSGGHTPRIVDDGTRTKLWRLCQGEQPWLPIDVSWLSVGHADEIVSFIATPSGRYKMLFPDTVLMRKLLILLAEEDAGTCRYKFHVGQWGRDNHGNVATREFVGQGGIAAYDELSVYQLQGPEFRVVNNNIQAHKLDHLAQRLATGLAFAPADIVKLPVYFAKAGANCYDAVTPNVVNLQMARGHLLVPRPFGARLPAVRARAVLTSLLGREVDVPASTGFYHWGFPGEYLLRIALYYLPLQRDVYTADMDALRFRLIKNMNFSTGAVVESTFTQEMEACMAAAEAFATDIARHNRNGRVTPPEAGAMKSWERVWIPLPDVDIVEELIVQILHGHGVPRARIHFIDSWAYHKKQGNLHCATNALADPPASWMALDAWDAQRPAPPFPYRA